MSPAAGPASGARIDVTAHLGHYLGTIGFFVPALILIGLVVGAVVRDRRRHANDTAAEGPGDSATPPRAD
ncbi:MAG: hypothetical protein ACXVX8_16010 [Blastococcus sp.]